MSQLMDVVCRKIKDTFMCKSGPEFSPGGTKASFILEDGNFLDVEKKQYDDFKLIFELGVNGILEFHFSASLDQGPFSFEEASHYCKYALLAQRTWLGLMDQRNPRFTGGCRDCPDLQEENENGPNIN
jgi:hypothetical protein